MICQENGCECDSDENYPEEDEVPEESDEEKKCAIKDTYFEHPMKIHEPLPDRDFIDDREPINKKEKKIFINQCKLNFDIKEELLNKYKKRRDEAYLKYNMYLNLQNTYENYDQTLHRKIADKILKYKNFLKYNEEKYSKLQNVF